MRLLWISFNLAGFGAACRLARFPHDREGCGFGPSCCKLLPLRTCLAKSLRCKITHYKSVFGLVLISYGTLNEVIIFIG